MVSDKVGDLYVNYSNNHIGSDPVVSNNFLGRAIETKARVCNLAKSGQRRAAMVI